FDQKKPGDGRSLPAPPATPALPPTPTPLPTPPPAPPVDVRQEAINHFQRGMAWYGQRQWDLAINEFSNAINLDPTYADAYAYRGSCSPFKGDFHRAIEDFSLALRNTPSLPASAYKCRAQSYLCLQRFDEAVSALNEVLKLAPNDLSARQLLAVALQQKALRMNGR